VGHAGSHQAQSADCGLRQVRREPRFTRIAGACANTRTGAHSHSHAHTDTDTGAHADAHTDTGAHSHADAHTDTYTYTNTSANALSDTNLAPARIP
jgi:hypothetical protein